jgi:hypothetical protein
MSSGRPDYDKLIKPEEAAQTIYNLSQNNQTLNVNEVTIKRKYH